MACRRLPRSVVMAVKGGSELGVTLGDDVSSFGELRFVPRIAPGPVLRSQRTTAMGEEIALPVLISPTGVQAVHPDGELPIARAAAVAGTAIGLSSFATVPVEEIVQANPKTFFQVYWLGGRGRIEGIVDRARAAGARGLIVTLDWVFAHRRDWGAPAIPERLTVATALRYAPQAVARPGWLWSYLRRGSLPRLRTPNLAQPSGEVPGFSDAYREWMETPLPSWEDLAWLRELWDGPLMLKGVTHPEDARRAAAIGATAISVSTHGGNSLDGTVASIRALPAVAAAVGGEIEIFLDGGVRRGADAVKALALGARAVMIGRPYLWGLGAAGEAGVGRVLEIIRAGIDETLLGLGRQAVADLVAGDVVVPPGFAVAAGVQRGTRPVLTKPR